GAAWSGAGPATTRPAPSRRRSAATRGCGRRWRCSPSRAPGSAWSSGGASASGAGRRSSGTWCSRRPASPFSARAWGASFCGASRLPATRESAAICRSPGQRSALVAPLGQVLEPRVGVEERQAAGAGGAVALLADDDLGHALVLLLALVLGVD